MNELRGVLELFQLALTLPQNQQSELLEREESRNPELAAEVRVLIGLHEDLENSTFLQQPALGGVSHLANGKDPNAPEIASYRILEPIGKGGMALVYLAEQREPVSRRVAIKVLRTGIDSGEALARFQLEQRALAAMDHPNVAKILDSGTTIAGRPYFVMEYVPGISITDFCWQRKLSTRERLGLFQQVCAAIEHAHQMGIIHRDIKPSNILVSDDGHAANVRLIDFGIAKTLHRLIQETLHTRRDQLIGTPEYMSPEQLRMDNTTVDTRTDVYSLGILLFEILAGVTPFGESETGANTLGAVRDAVLNKEPRRASTVSEYATEGRLAAPVPGKQLRGDLDWILLRALEKERNRRYSTVQELAEDIRRHLDDEPVSAGPPSTVYRLKKFVRRNRVASIVATLLLLIGVFVGASFTRTYERHKRQSEETVNIYRDLFEHSSSPIMTFNAGSGLMIEFNQATLDLFYYSREEFGELTVFDLSAEKNATAVAVGKIEDGETKIVPRRAFRRKDGSVFYAAIHTGRYTWKNQVMLSGVLQPLEDDGALDGKSIDPANSASR